MHVLVSNFNGNPNVGLYGLVTDSFVLLGKEIPSSYDKDLEKVLGLPVKRITIAGTSLVGVFCLWTGKKLLVPSIAFSHELAALEELEIPLSIINTDLTCLGNNIVLSDKAALLNPDFTDEDAALLADALEVPCIKRTIMDIEAIGSIGVIHNKLGVFHRDILPQEIKELEEELGIKITTGTVNMGNPYIKSGIMVSEKGFVIGESSGGPEITNIDEALGFIQV